MDLETTSLKIIDAKLINNEQYYKISWEPTWEAESNLLDYQHSIDSFWTSVNEHSSHQFSLQVPFQKKIKHEFELAEKTKEDVQKLIGRTKCSSSPPEMDTILHSPHDMLTNTLRSFQNNLAGFKQKECNMGVLKDSTSGAKDSTSGLSVLEQFDSPYVKIILACKECLKKMPIKNGPAYWKRHFDTHLPAEAKPLHVCETCGKTFSRKDNLTVSLIANAFH